jgi:26S proteasome regulatory subunit T5
MNALRREAKKIGHEDFVYGIAEVQAKKKSSLQYYA